jgi:hypothetical protein
MRIRINEVKYMFVFVMDIWDILALIGLGMVIMYLLIDWLLREAMK